MPSRQNYGMFVHATTRQDRNHVCLQNCGLTVVQLKKHLTDNLPTAGVED